MKQKIMLILVLAFLFQVQVVESVAQNPVIYEGQVINSRIEYRKEGLHYMLMYQGRCR